MIKETIERRIVVKYNYDYSKLRGRIKEYYNTQEAFAKSINLSATSLNNKLNNKIPFTQEEIYDAITNLKIEALEIQDIFFTKIVEKN
jgi:DNA-binding XRE family transcriptional regulator